eukprot:g66688.t1
MRTWKDVYRKRGTPRCLLFGEQATLEARCTGANRTVRSPTTMVSKGSLAMGNRQSGRNVLGAPTNYIVPREEPWYPSEHLKKGIPSLAWHATIMEMEYWSLRLGFNILPEDWQTLVGRCNYCAGFQPPGSVNYDYAIFAFQRLTRYEIVQDGPTGTRYQLPARYDTKQLREVYRRLYGFTDYAENSAEGAQGVDEPVAYTAADDIASDKDREASASGRHNRAYNASERDRRRKAAGCRWTTQRSDSTPARRIGFGIGECLHMDFRGPWPIRSLEGNRRLLPLRREWHNPQNYCEGRAQVASHGCVCGRPRKETVSHIYTTETKASLGGTVTQKRTFRPHREGLHRLSTVTIVEQRCSHGTTTQVFKDSTDEKSEQTSRVDSEILQPLDGQKAVSKRKKSQIL